MIKLTVKQLIDATTRKIPINGSLQDGMAQNGSALDRLYALEKPIHVAWANRKQAAACNEELKHYHEKRLALCEKFGVKNDKLNIFEFDGCNTEFSAKSPGPQKKAFDAALLELWSQEIELPGRPIKISELADSSFSSSESSGSLSEFDCQLLEPFLAD